MSSSYTVNKNEVRGGWGYHVEVTKFVENVSGKERYCEEHESLERAETIEVQFVNRLDLVNELTAPVRIAKIQWAILMLCEHMVPKQMECWNCTVKKDEKIDFNDFSPENLKKIKFKVAMIKVRAVARRNL